jgi:8-oxo-dGTP pyrophosphatase MutT (NUDIX family)
VTVQVEAAGAVVLRTGVDGPEVLVVHRPRYDDWSFPKGKLDPGEDWQDGARREVVEETAYRVELGVELPDVRYTDRRGRSKRVRYWCATVVTDNEFVPNDEVDERRWVALTEVARVLTYDHDRALVTAVERL